MSGNMQIIDYHIHSNNSFDGMNSVISICDNAIKSGVSEICFTEHFSVDSTDVSYNVLDYKKYHKEIKECQELFEGKLIIKEGLEIGEPHIKNLKCNLNKEIGKMDLDFIIGSVHNIGTLKLRSYMKGKNKKEIYEDYFQEVYEMAKNSDLDVIGHLDLMKRYAYNSFKNYNFEEHADIIRSILKEIIKRNIGIEVNTSGLRSDVKEIFPSVEIIKLYKELGGEIVTIGSDAHDAKSVGSGYFFALEMLKNTGFGYIFKFEKRKPIGIIIK